MSWTKAGSSARRRRWGSGEPLLAAVNALPRRSSSLQLLLDDSNTGASERSAISGDVIAGLANALSCGEEIECRLADAGPGVLCAVPAARVRAAVGRPFA